MKSRPPKTPATTPLAPAPGCCVPTPDPTSTPFPSTTLFRSSSLAFLIGPEGGLTDNEVATAQDAGYHAARLGPRVLRTETAPVVALSVAQQLWGDF